MNIHTALWKVHWYNTKPEHFKLKVSNLGHVRILQREILFPNVCGVHLYIWSTVCSVFRWGGPVEISSIELARQEIANLIRDKEEDKARRKAVREQKWHIREVMD